MTTKILFTVAALAALLAIPVHLVTAAQGNTGNKDTNFIGKVADANMTEIRLAKIALENGQKQDVRDFANRMLRDHGNASDELKPIAQKLNVTIPEQVSQEHQQAIDKLSNLKGKDFDDAYAHAMVSDHTKVVAMFEKAESNVQNTDLKKFAADTLPILKEHLEQAKKL